MMKNKFKAVIFDLDGTLLDSLESISMGSNAVLEELGFKPLSIDDYRMLVGKGARELIKQALTVSGDKELKFLDRAIEIHKVAYKKYALYNIKKYDGIDEALKQLKGMGIFIAVNTNKPEERAFGVLDTMFGNIFDVIVGQVDSRPRKPAPDGCLYITEKLGLKNEECIYIGDTETDMKTGKAAGMYTVGALWGFRTRKELEDNGADIIIQSPTELIDIING